jgi:hypothetical protein
MPRAHHCCRPAPARAPAAAAIERVQHMFDLDSLSTAAATVAARPALATASPARLQAMLQLMASVLPDSPLAGIAPRARDVLLASPCLLLSIPCATGDADTDSSVNSSSSSSSDNNLVALAGLDSRLLLLERLAAAGPGWEMVVRSWADGPAADIGAVLAAPGTAARVAWLLQSGATPPQPSSSPSPSSLGATTEELAPQPAASRDDNTQPQQPQHSTSSLYELLLMRQARFELRYPGFSAALAHDAGMAIAEGSKTSTTAGQDGGSSSSSSGYGGKRRWKRWLLSVAAPPTHVLQQPAMT